MEIIFVIVVIFIFFVLPKKKEAATKAANDKWDAQQAKYEDIVCQLPPDLLNKLLSLLKQACNRINVVVPDSVPEELMKMTMATINVVKKGSTAAITREQYKQISYLLDNDLNWIVNEFIPAANKALCQLADSDGLGFGLITNSAADAMLYSALDTHQRLKGNEKKIREYEEMIDKRLVPIFDKILQILS